MMDPSVPGLRDWYRGYLKALLEEYARDIDGLVWDETFYIPDQQRGVQAPTPPPFGSMKLMNSNCPQPRQPRP
jgi:hypothetical protein